MTRLHAALLLVATLALGGCTYTVEVRNAAPEPITVRLLQLDPIQPDWLLGSARIDPGQRARLTPARVAMARVVLEATVPGSDDEPVRREVGSGKSVIRIEMSETSDGRRLSFHDDPAPWTSNRARIRLNPATAEAAPPPD